MPLVLVLCVLCQYRLPWEDGKAVVCAQGNNGSTSHSGNEKFAFDFSMPEGTRICAARGGKVVSIKEDESEGGLEARFRGKGNHVKVDHGDGTVALYLHLQKDGALVDAGDTVLQGDVIALSGKTGYVTGPHLHFQVNKGNSWESTAIAFSDVETDAGVPQGGRTYVSRNTPGIPAATKDEITAHVRAIKLARQYGAWSIAWARLKRLSELKLKVKYEPVDTARAQMDDLVKAGEAHVAEIEKMPLEDAVRAYLLARRAYDGTPVEKLVDRLPLQTKDDYHAARAKALAVDRAQEAFFRGLKAEIEGRASEPAYKDAVKAAPDSTFGKWAAARLKK